jgi:hypothetical protein
MGPPFCHDCPEIFLRLTLDVGKDCPVIWRQKGNSNNRIQTMLVCNKKSRKLAVTFLNPHSIMVLLDATPLCHDQPKIHLRPTLNINEDGSVIWG